MEDLAAVGSAAGMSKSRAMRLAREIREIVSSDLGDIGPAALG